MRKMIGVLTLGMIVAVVGASQAWAGHSKSRPTQGQRIYQGVRSGELTPAEARILLKEQYRIARAVHRARNDAFISPLERMRLREMHVAASRHIYDLKHNHRRSR